MILIHSRYTCIVEYALICAGISFVFWTNVGKGPSEYQKKKANRVSLYSNAISVISKIFLYKFVIITQTMHYKADLGMC